VTEDSKIKLLEDEENRKVSKEEGMKLAKKFKMKFVEMSVKESQIRDVFISMCEDVLQTKISTQTLEK